MTRSRLLASSSPTTTTQPHYSLLVAGDASEVRAAQRLRYRVFADEMGAHVSGHRAGETDGGPDDGKPDAPGIDADHYDAFCDHLIVREETTGQVVGTYRMLPPARADEAGGLYSENEFDLSSLAPLRTSLVEAGRSCVHPEHRSGAVVSLVWAGIARYMLLAGHTWLAGCASVPLADGGGLAAAVWDRVSVRAPAPSRYAVQPHRPWQSDGVARPDRTVLPPLLRGYLRLGAWVCGPPAHDPEFGVADFFVLLSLEQADQRYLRFFLGDGRD